MILVATDKDLKQCLHDNVMMWDPASRDEKIVTLKSFEEETGLRPTQWPDVQAIIGDSSDNIPGVRGVGPKTAEKLFHEYASLEAIRDGFASMKPPCKKNSTASSKPCSCTASSPRWTPAAAPPSRSTPCACAR